MRASASQGGGKQQFINHQQWKDFQLLIGLWIAARASSTSFTNSQTHSSFVHCFITLMAIRLAGLRPPVRAASLAAPLACLLSFQRISFSSISANHFIQQLFQLSLLCGLLSWLCSLLSAEPLGGARPITHQKKKSQSKPGLTALN